MGEYTIAKDPTRAKGLRILMGPFTVYNKTMSRRPRRIVEFHGYRAILLA